MTVRAFLDTNILVYLMDHRDPAKTARSRELIRQGAADGSAVISYQVVQEFLNVATTKFKTRMSGAEAAGFADNLLWPLCEVFPTPALFSHALAIREKTGWTFYDGLIVAAALLADCRTLYSEDLQAGRVLEGLEIVNPFA